MKTVIQARKRFAKNRRRREARDRVARDWEFASLVRRVPRPVMMALLTSVRDQCPDALARLPSPWRERALASWQETLAERAAQSAAVVVPLRPPAGPASVVD
jgi:hypothetical protein